jgi:methionyl-tRNA formyltransferase
MNQKKTYLVAGVKPWSRRVFDEVISAYPGQWYFTEKREALTEAFIQGVNPRFIFFLHWSWKVPASVFQPYECVCFHMTDLPYGRGGSPLQNLILRGHRQTKLSALRMVEEMDAGPVYLKRALSLEGNAEEIYLRAAYLSAEMIRYLIETTPTPEPQQGTAVHFERRTFEQSRIPSRDDLNGLYDFIRMLDAEGYPRAFLEHQGFRYEFRRGAISNNHIRAEVHIQPMKGHNG